MDSKTDKGPSSITQQIPGLLDGEEDAIAQLWRHYRTRLVELADRRMFGASRRLKDGEDIAASVFMSLCRAASEGRIDDIRCRDDLWIILISITKKKVVDHYRHESAAIRGGGKVANFSELTQQDTSRNTIVEVLDDAPTPGFMLALDEEFRRLISILRDDSVRQVAKLKIEGFRDREIAERSGASLRSVERKLQLVRSTWRRELLDRT